MKRSELLFPLSGLVAVLVMLVALGRAKRDAAEPPQPPAFTLVESHRVTDRMLEEAVRRDGTPAPAFHAVDEDGKAHEGPTTGDRPTLLVFIKDGCPCSTGMQPYFNRLARSYANEVRVLGVIDAEGDRALAWCDENRTAFPVLCDPKQGIMRDYDATNSAYVALIHPEGQIDMLWPGVSAGMLEALGGRIAALAGVEPRSIDVTKAPEELYSGCSFDFEPTPSKKD